MQPNGAALQRRVGSPASPPVGEDAPCSSNACSFQHHTSPFAALVHTGRSIVLGAPPQPLAAPAAWRHNTSSLPLQHPWSIIAAPASGPWSSLQHWRLPFQHRRQDISAACSTRRLPLQRRRPGLTAPCSIRGLSCSSDGCSAAASPCSSVTRSTATTLRLWHRRPAQLAAATRRSHTAWQQWHGPELQQRSRHGSIGKNPWQREKAKEGGSSW